MNFGLDDEHEEWRRTVKRFVEREVPREYIRKTDNEHVAPTEAWEKVAAQGWLGLLCPEKYGGIDGDIFYVGILLEEIGRRSQDLAVMIFRTLLHCNMRLAWHGTEEQRAFFLPRAVKGEIKFALGLSEPNTGNDAASLTTKARRDGDTWVIDGHKMWTTGFQLSDYCIVVARTDPSAPKRHMGLTAFMVDSKSPGITFRTIPTLARWPIPTCEVWFDAVRVPASMVLGKANEGWRDLMAHLTAERFCAGAMWVGEAEAAFDDALQYAKTRTQFGQPIGKYQAVSHRIAEMRIQLDAARLLLYRVGESVEKGEPDRIRSAVMKCFISDMFKKVSLDGLQVMGGFGYSMEMDMQRYVRDALLGPIGPGSNDIMRNVIAKELGL